VNLGLFQILIIVLIVVVLFWRRRIGETMDDVGEGIRSFRKGLGGDENAAPHIDGAVREAQAAADAAADKTAG
jgi:sec-independent protein translocase protein TatA